MEKLRTRSRRGFDLLFALSSKRHLSHLVRRKKTKNVRDDVVAIIISLSIHKEATWSLSSAAAAADAAYLCSSSPTRSPQFHLSIYLLLPPHQFPHALGSFNCPPFLLQSVCSIMIKSHQHSTNRLRYGNHLLRRRILRMDRLVLFSAEDLHRF